MEYASKAVGTAGLTTGIIGTGLGAISSGLLGNLFGGTNNSASQSVSKEVGDLTVQLLRAETQNAILSADLNSEKKMVEVYNSLNDKINKVITDQTAINAAQAVTNCGFTSAIAVAQNNISQLMGMASLKINSSSICTGNSGTTTT